MACAKHGGIDWKRISENRIIARQQRPMYYRHITYLQCKRVQHRDDHESHCGSRPIRADCSLSIVQSPSLLGHHTPQEFQPRRLIPISSYWLMLAYGRNPGRIPLGFAAHAVAEMPGDAHISGSRDEHRGRVAMQNMHCSAVLHSLTKHHGDLTGKALERTAPQPSSSSGFMTRSMSCSVGRRGRPTTLL